MLLDMLDGQFKDLSRTKQQHEASTAEQKPAHLHKHHVNPGQQACT